MSASRTLGERIGITAFAVCLLLFAILAKRSQYPDAPLDPHFGKSLKYEQAVSRPAVRPAVETLIPEFIVVGRVVTPALLEPGTPDIGSSPDGRAPPSFSSL